MTAERLPAPEAGDQHRHLHPSIHLSRIWDKSAMDDWNKKALWAMNQVTCLGLAEELIGRDELDEICEIIDFLRLHAGSLEVHLAEMRGFQNQLWHILPYTEYLDPPDGGDVSLYEQLRRMSVDASSWRHHEERMEQRVPVAWIRYCSDGCYEGPVMHHQCEEIRRKSGAWTPLFE